MNNDEMFSLFASFLAVGLDAAKSIGDLLATMERAVGETGLRIGASGRTMRGDCIVSGSERLVFDIKGMNLLLKDCDIVIQRSALLTVVNLGMPQDSFLLQGFLDFAKKEGLLWNLVVSFFSHDEIVAAKVAVEDSFSIGTLNAFRPGDWNAFRDGWIPGFLDEVKPNTQSGDVSFFSDELIFALGMNEREMGRSLLKTLGVQDQ